MAEQGKPNNTLLIILVLIAGAGVVYFATMNKGNDWRETYYPESKEPYNTWLLKEVMAEKYGANFQVLDSSLKSSLKEPVPAGNSTYIFIGDRPYYDSLEVCALLDFVKSGNTAFISTNSLSGRLTDTLFIEKYGEEWEFDEDLENYHSVPLPEMNFFPDSSIQLSHNNSANKTVELTFIYNNVTDVYYWGYFRDSIYTKAGLIPEYIGYINDTLVNAMKVNYGKGEFILHSTPIVFTNYFFRNKSVFDYTNDNFGFIPEGGNVLWDEANLYLEQGETKESNNNTPPVKHGPLSFILSQPGLKWAWYSLLLMGLFYVLFGARRKQSAIPIIEKRQNTSIEFAETLSQLYGSKNDHRQIAQLKWKLFLSYLRRNYGLNTNIPDEQSREALMVKVSLKSGLNPDEIRQLFKSYQNILIASEVSAELLNDFHNKTSYFYKNSK